MLSTFYLIQICIHLWIQEQSLICVVLFFWIVFDVCIFRRLTHGMWHKQLLQNISGGPRPGTCNLFQVTGQIATLQWSPGPDNVEHVNEG